MMPVRGEELCAGFGGALWMILEIQVMLRLRPHDYKLCYVGLVRGYGVCIVLNGTIYFSLYLKGNS